MKAIDLTHVICPDMPVYPGTEGPVLQPANTLERDGFAEARIAMHSHTGTHMDAPAHLLRGAPTLDRLDVGRFIGPAVLVNCSGVAGERIDIADLQDHEEAIREADFVVLRTGWSRYWGAPGYFDRYPVLSLDAARWLAGFPLKGVCVDAISVDGIAAPDLPVHRVFLERGIVIVENLASLDSLPGDRFTLSVLPLKIAAADGSPVRAVAIFSGAP